MCELLTRQAQGSSVRVLQSGESFQALLLVATLRAACIGISRLPAGPTIIRLPDCHMVASESACRCRNVDNEKKKKTAVGPGV